MARKIGTETLVVFALALVGCRAVIGIEDLKLADDASIAIDSAADVTPDAPVTADAGDAAPPIDAARTLADCNKLCRTDGGLGDAASNFSDEMRSCMCQGGVLKACTSECGGL
jgi:hypothetical protein